MIAERGAHDQGSAQRGAATAWQEDRILIESDFYEPSPLLRGLFL